MANDHFLVQMRWKPKPHGFGHHLQYRSRTVIEDKIGDWSEWMNIEVEQDE